MAARETKRSKAIEPIPAVLPPNAERKVLHTPYSIQHRHLAVGGGVLAVLEKSFGTKIRAKVSHRPDGIYYLVTMQSGAVQPFLFDEASGRLMLQQR